MKIIRKGLTLAITYVILQVLLMLLIHLVFSINLFEIDKNGEMDFISALSTKQLKFFVFLNQFFGLFLPALIYLLIIYGKSIFDQIELPSYIIPERVVVALAVLIFSYPLVQFLAEINQWIPITSWMDETALRIEDQMAKLVEMDGPKSLIITILLIAVLPAVSEELFFRALIQKELIQLFKHEHIGVWLGAIIFSAFHLQFDGFLPRLGLGLLLGYVYLYTRSLWIPVIMHFINNAIMVLLLYFNSEEQEVIPGESPEFSNFMLVIVSAIVVVYLLINLKRKSREHGLEKTV